MNRLFKLSTSTVCLHPVATNLREILIIYRVGQILTNRGVSFFQISVSQEMSNHCQIKFNFPLSADKIRFSKCPTSWSPHLLFCQRRTRIALAARTQRFVGCQRSQTLTPKLFQSTGRHVRYKFVHSHLYVQLGSLGISRRYVCSATWNDTNYRTAWIGMARGKWDLCHETISTLGDLARN